MSEIEKDKSGAGQPNLNDVFEHPGLYPDLEKKIHEAAAPLWDWIREQFKDQEEMLNKLKRGEKAGIEANPLYQWAKEVAVAMEATKQMLAPIAMEQVEFLRAVQKAPMKNAIQQLAWGTEKPEAILAMAVVRGRERRAVLDCIGRLLGRIRATSGVIAGEPPKLVILGGALSYEEIMDLEDFPEAKKLDGSMTMRMAMQEIPRIVRDLKSHTHYKQELEIKRQAAKARYQELSFESFVEEHPQWEPGEDGLWGLYNPEFRPEEHVIKSIGLEDFLRDLRELAEKRSWRKDRVENMLRVADYMIEQREFRVLEASASLGIHRDTIHERIKDLGLLIEPNIKMNDDGLVWWQHLDNF